MNELEQVRVIAGQYSKGKEPELSDHMFVGYFKVLDQAGSFNGIVFDVYGTARMEGVYLPKRKLGFVKQYFADLPERTYGEHLEYEFIPAGDRWAGKYKYRENPDVGGTSHCHVWDMDWGFSGAHPFTRHLDVYPKVFANLGGY